MLKTKAARHSCNYARANKSTRRDKQIIAREFERGSLIGGLLIVFAFGLMFIHAAVVL